MEKRELEKNLEKIAENVKVTDLEAGIQKEFLGLSKHMTKGRDPSRVKCSD